MGTQRSLLGLVLMMVMATAALAQSDPGLRWRSSALGLQPTVSVPALPCGSFAFSCGDAASVPLYASTTSPRSLSMQVGALDAAQRLQGTNISFVGRAGLFSDFGVYGRVGTTVLGGPPALSPVPLQSGMNYGVGVSWDFARRGSAALGLDSYDLRSATRDGRDLRTSLGLQWRY